MFKRVITTFFMLFIAQSLLALDSRVVAIVGDRAITQRDLDSRTELMMKTSGYEASDKDSIRALRAQILELLIDENLISIDANRLGISLDDQEVLYALEQIAAQNNMKLNEFLRSFSEVGGNVEELKKQIGGQFLWQKLIQARLQPEVTVTRTEISDGLKLFNAQASSVKDEVNKLDISSIMIVDDNKDAEDFANELMDQLKKGVAFEKLASEFSQANNASNGGRMGVVSINQLKEAQHKMKKAKAGEVIGPIKVAGNWMIYKVNAIASEALTQKEAEVTELIKGRKLNASIRAYLRKLRRETYVEIKK